MYADSTSFACGVCRVEQVYVACSVLLGENALAALIHFVSVHLAPFNDEYFVEVPKLLFLRTF